MGWALRQSRSRDTRITDKRNDFLIAKFQTGEQTGQKADAAIVLRVMRSEKDENVERLFDSFDFLEAGKFLIFFFHLASQRSLDHQEVNRSDDDE